VGETGTTSVWYMGSWTEGAELGRLSAWGSVRFFFFLEDYFPSPKKKITFISSELYY
jgi:hypothetical protein